MTAPDRSPWLDPRVKEALDDGFSPDDIDLVGCLNCSGFSYYNESEPWTCRFCGETLANEDIDEIDIITLSEYTESMETGEKDVP